MGRMRMIFLSPQLAPVDGITWESWASGLGTAVLWENTNIFWGKKKKSYDELDAPSGAWWWRYSLLLECAHCPCFCWWNLLVSCSLPCFSLGAFSCPCPWCSAARRGAGAPQGGRRLLCACPEPAESCRLCWGLAAPLLSCPFWFCRVLAWSLR